MGMFVKETEVMTRRLGGRMRKYRKVYRERSWQTKIGIARGMTKSCMRRWTLRKEKMTCTDWLDRGTKLGRMCSRLG